MIYSGLMLVSSSCAISSHQAPCVVHRNSPSTCSLNMQTPPTRTGSERFWAKERPWAMRQPWAPSKDGRGVALLSPCSDPRPGDRRAYAPSCCTCWLLLAPSTENLSGDSPLLKTAALPKPTPLFGAADILGRQMPNSPPRAPLRFKAGGPGLCWSSCRVALAAATGAASSCNCSLGQQVSPPSTPLNLPVTKISVSESAPEIRTCHRDLRDVSSNWMCLTAGPGVHVFSSKTE